jgi:hypothetical protein
LVKVPQDEYHFDLDLSAVKDLAWVGVKRLVLVPRMQKTQCRETSIFEQGGLVRVGDIKNI